MIRILIIGLLLSWAAIARDGPDFMLLGISHTPDRVAFSLCSAHQEDDGFRASFQDASLYGIGSLRWTYGGLRYSYRCWTVGGTFRNYGIHELYESTRYSVIVHRLLAEKYSLGLGFARCDRNFGAGLYRGAASMLQLNFGINFEPVSFAAELDNIVLDDRDDIYGDPELYLGGSWLADEALTVFGLYYRDAFHHDRFLFGQNLNLNKTVIISAGLMSGPEIYFVGMEVIYKGFLFGYTFYDLSGLPNCAKVTVSYR